MGIVIPFEVVRQDKPDTDAETRIQEKEAIYRGLFAKEAVREGRSFEEMYEIIVTEDRENNEKQEQDGIVFSGDEEKLDLHIKALQLWVNTFAPHIKDGSDTVPALK